jgi:hypothetical protein
MPNVKIEKCLNCGIGHNWFFEGLTLRELRQIKIVSGMSQKEFAKAGDDGDPESLAILLWILHNREKIKIPFEDIDLDFNDFAMELTAQEQKEYDTAELARKNQGPKSKKSSNGKTPKVE